MSTTQEALDEFLQLEKRLGLSNLTETFPSPARRSNNPSRPNESQHSHAMHGGQQHHGGGGGGGDEKELDAFFHRASTLLSQLDEQMDPAGFRYCESCSDGIENNERKPARVFCKQCGGHLCEECDREYHPKRNMLMRKHKRVPIESLRPSIFCKAHPDDEVTYYCLDCEVSCVCTECVVHGPHKTHNVQQISKAQPIVKSKVEHLLQTITARMEEVSIMEAKIHSHRQEIIDNTQSIKESMAQSFNEVRERIRKKEEELMLQADEFASEQCGQLDNYAKAAREKVEQIDVAAEIIRTRLSDNDAVSLINYYAEHRDDMVELASTKPPLPDLPQVANRKCFLNMDATNQQIEALNGLHLIIATLKGVDNQQQQQQQQQQQHNHSGAGWGPSRGPGFSPGSSRAGRGNGNTSQQMQGEHGVGAGRR